MLTNRKGVSTLILIILILCSAVFGAFLSYMWVMSNFYLEPENTSLVITNVNFPVDHADYFYVTVMNPSHSPSATNITSISFTAEGDNEVYNVTSTSPETLPITLEIGTNKTIKCERSWGEFAGKTITVHVSASSASGATASVKTSFVKLRLAVEFDSGRSCRYFYVSVINDQQSAINLTLKKLYVNLVPIENATQVLGGQSVIISGTTLPNNGQPLYLQCLHNWEGNMATQVVRVETYEGYYAEATANVTANAVLQIKNVVFNKMKSDEFNITILNSESSSTYVDIANITLTYDTSQHNITGSLSNPSLPYRLEKNSTVTFNCTWSWRDYRDKNVTITVYTKQEYTPASKTVKTPKEIVFNINASFDLTDMAHFSVKVANMPCSLQNITVTEIKLNTNPTSFTSRDVPIGEWRQFDCTFDWASFRGSTITLTVNASNVSVSQNVTLPYVKLRIINANFTASENGKVLNVSTENIGNSTVSATIARLVVSLGNETVFRIDGIQYMVGVGKNVTLVFSWNWSEYEGETVTIHVYTAEGLEFAYAFIV
jgi:hypothetical protein